MPANQRDLTYQLNRLANTLVNGRPTLADAAAANKWAGTSGLGARPGEALLTPGAVAGLDARWRARLTPHASLRVVDQVIEVQAPAPVTGVD